MRILEITVQELADWLKQQEPLVLLDVRLPEEHARCALPDSRLIPLSELSQRYQELSVPFDVPLVVYCHHGVRSWHAAAFLRQRGFDQAVSLRGGVEAWAVAIDPRFPRY